MKNKKKIRRHIDYMIDADVAYAHASGVKSTERYVTIYKGSTIS